jgi:hypothetical protein
MFSGIWARAAYSWSRRRRLPAVAEAANPGTNEGDAEAKSAERWRQDLPH